VSAWQEALKLATQKELKSRGLQVFIKTPLAPELKVFDSKDTELTGAGSGASFVGVTIKDKDGNLVTNYGGQPETDFFLQATIVAFLAMVVFFFVRGVVA